MISKMRIAGVLGAIVLLASACDGGNTPLSPTVGTVRNGGQMGGGNVVEPPTDSTTYGANSATSPAPDEAAPGEGGQLGGGN